ncbi:MAG: toll/interleukin-1 receptor domain-containing protein [Defluviitaleaceae bacterium]|nr:toll/interleukin-1 receptor domain-containing protein [Defluviitaleaceae bacterium]
MDLKYDIFISFKHTDEHGSITKDTEIAENIYHFLTERGCKVFYSPIELEFIGKAQYSRVIDDALKASRFMVVVGCRPEHFDSGWVSYEWGSFLNAVRSGVKPHSEVFILYEDMSPADLPWALAQQQAFNNAHDNALETLYNFIHNALKGIVQDEEGRAIAPPREPRPTPPTARPKKSGRKAVIAAILVITAAAAIAAFFVFPDPVNFGEFVETAVVIAPEPAPAPAPDAIPAPAQARPSLEMLTAERTFDPGAAGGRPLRVSLIGTLQRYAGG